MATRIFAIPPNGQLDEVKENVGPTATSAIIGLVVDLASTGVSVGGSTRTVSKSEVLLAVETLKQYLIKTNWPPA